jgi:hypothetical protein
MQYEAKIDETGDGIGDENTTCKYSSSYSTWNDYNSAAGCSYTLNNRQIVSSAQGYPLASINQTTALAACSSLGANYHLMTNEERMTILRNIEIMPDNWTSGIVGTASLKMGNTSSCTVASACYNGPDPDYGTRVTSNYASAKLVLTNGSEIWDLSGNVWEWLDENISLANEPDGVYDTNDSNYIGDQWFDYKKGGGAGYYLINTGGLNYKDLKLLNSDYGTANGIGRIYSYSNTAGTAESYRWLFGGPWYYGTNAGPLALLMFHDATSQGFSLGFRCVSQPV